MVLGGMPVIERATACALSPALFTTLPHSIVMGSAPPTSRAMPPLATRPDTTGLPSARDAPRLSASPR